MNNLRFLLPLAATVLVATPATTLAQNNATNGAPSAPQAPLSPPIYLPRGVVVVASKDASIAETWRLATRVYQDPALRPRGMNDATARALAGEAPPKGSAANVREWFDLRASITVSGAATRRLLKSIASELGVSAVALTYQTQSGQTQARLFLAQQQAFHSTILWPQPKGKQRSWAPSVAWLSSLTSKQTKRSDDRSTSVFTSPWFWGAITAAVGAAIVGYAVTRNDDEDVIHLQGQVNP